ncbi:MAG: 2-C-methyl-D-erythritol 4-phosphate cytidylyltransferase [Acidobacteriota bacterium]|nr:MAG: 2-C-methyl-D-erythritol 4-phosphate cytidylyltransferase [Acidobacteriota bacterium]
MATASAVIVAGGAGNRFRSETPKQFLALSGKPLLAHTLSRFDACAAIARIVLVLPRDGFAAALETMERFVGDKPTDIVPGGDTRQASVREGLRCLDPCPESLIAVHDGARPLVDEELITRVVARASEHGGAIAAVPVVETLKEVSEAMTIERTVDRKRYYRAQTPQCFRYGILREAYDAARRDGFVGTDEAALVERLDATIHVVAGSEHNIKITTPDDMARAEYYLMRPRSSRG